MSVWWQPCCLNASMSESAVIGLDEVHGTPPPCGGETVAAYRSPTREITIGTWASLRSRCSKLRSAVRSYLLGFSNVSCVSGCRGGHFRE